MRRSNHASGRLDPSRRYPENPPLYEEAHGDFKLDPARDLVPTRAPPQPTISNETEEQEKFSLDPPRGNAAYII